MLELFVSKKKKKKSLGEVNESDNGRTNWISSAGNVEGEVLVCVTCAELVLARRARVHSSVWFMPVSFIFFPSRQARSTDNLDSSGEPAARSAGTGASSKGKMSKRWDALAQARFLTCDLLPDALDPNSSEANVREVLTHVPDTPAWLILLDFYFFLFQTRVRTSFSLVFLFFAKEMSKYLFSRDSRNDSNFL